MVNSTTDARRWKGATLGAFQQPKTLAEFYAVLANLERIEDLTSDERMHLARCFDAVSSLAPQERRPIGSGTWLEYVATALIRGLHVHARHVIVNLLAGKEVQIAGEDWPAPMWRLEGGKLVEKFRDLDSGRLFTDLLALIRNNPFPFRRCIACNRIFVRVRRQVFCSRQCASDFTETNRRGDRREYMRKYMADRRARQKRKAAKRKER